MESATEPFAERTGSDDVELSTRSPAPPWTVTALFGTVCVLLLLVLAAYCGVYLLEPSSSSKTVPVLCESTACVDLATAIGAARSRTVHPCDDFYGYVCGSRDATRTDSVKDEILQRVIDAINDLNRKVDVTAPPAQTAVQKVAMAFRACEDLVRKNASSMRAIDTVLRESGLFAPPVWAGPYNVANTSCILETSWQLAPFFTYRIERRASLVVLKPSRWALKRFARRARRAPLAADYDALREFFSPSQLGVHPLSESEYTPSDMSSEELRVIDHRVTRNLCAEFGLHGDYGLWNESTIASFIPGIGGPQWRQLVQTCLNHAEPVQYYVSNAGFIQKVLSMPMWIGPQLAQQYSRWYVIEMLAANYHGPWMIEMAGTPERALQNQQLQCHRALFKYAGRAFAARYVRSFFSADVLQDLNALHWHLIHAYDHVLWALRPYIPTFNLDAYEERYALDNQFNGTSNEEGGPFDIVAKSSDAYLDEAFRNYSSMTTVSFHNWLRLKVGFESSNEDEVIFTESVRPEQEGPAFYGFLDRAYKKEREFHFLPGITAIPFYRPDTPLVLKLGGMGSIIASALLSLLAEKGFVRQGNEPPADDVHYQRSASAGCARRVVRDLARECEVTSRLLEMAALQHLFKSQDQGYSVVVKDLPGLSGLQLQYVTWCYLECGGRHGRRRCNAPLRELPDFADAFDCPASAPMRNATTCAATLLGGPLRSPSQQLLARTARH